MRRYFFTFILIVFSVNCLYAQKKEISQARSIIKSGRDLERAEQQMRTLLQDSAHQGNLKVWTTLTDAVRSQYLAKNENMYLRQNQDTAALFRLALRMFHDYQSLDSVDAKPDSKGRIKTKYRDSHAAFLNTYRPNLYNGGIFYIRKQQYQEAFNMMDAFLDCQYQPLFSNLHYEKDSLNKSAAFWTVYCGFHLENSEMTLKYKDLALQDTLHLERCLRYLAETYRKQDNMGEYEKMLDSGVELYHDSPYFFPRLVDYYNATNQVERAMATVDEALASDSTSELFLYAKSNLLLNCGEYDACIAICDTLIARNDSLADAYYNAGVAYMNKAYVLDQGKVTAKQRRQIRQMYRRALPYMERFRELAADEKDKWAMALYKIYFQLNMGKEFEEIERLLR